MTKGIIDTHCDALLKLWEDSKRSFQNDPAIETNADRLQKGGVGLQLFALFVPPTIPQEEKFQVIMEQVEAFQQKVAPARGMKPLRTFQEIPKLQPGETGAILTLEGMDALGTDKNKLEWLYHHGVLSLGLTWNEANLCADGIGEVRGAGLTSFGTEVIQMNNERGILTDLSHLSLKGFWEAIALAEKPIASHSNAYALCSHRRNLRNDQLEALFTQKGYVGVVFHPEFLTGKETATIADIVRHIDYMCQRGGVHLIGFGSDFDGIPVHVQGLEDASCYANLVEELERHFSAEQVKGFSGENFKRMVLDSHNL
ncbi:dipeptidase [Shouchella shacheensis]|uniref:dipeptidase n=1 Tax=Shouchella shacheensis TaxID=1649580 RepID=UPI0007403781|nr:dipeptidase [Shouchella shacheensis]